MFFKYYLMLLKIRTTRIDRNYKIIKGVYTEVFVELYILFPKTVIIKQGFV